MAAAVAGGFKEPVVCVGGVGGITSAALESDAAARIKLMTAAVAAVCTLQALGQTLPCEGSFPDAGGTLKPEAVARLLPVEPLSDDTFDLPLGSPMSMDGFI